MMATLNQKEVAISNWKNLVSGISAAQVALGVASSAVGIAASIVTFGAATPVLLGLAIWGVSAGVASQAAKAGLQNARASDEDKEEGYFAKAFKGLMKKDARNKGAAISGTKGTAKALSLFGEGEAANMVGTVAGPAGAILGTALSSKTIIDMRKIDPKEVYQKLDFAELQKDLVLLAVELKKNYMLSAGRFNEMLYILLEHKIRTTNEILNKYKG